MGAESRCEVRRRPERAVVESALEADPAQGRVPRLDPYAERQIDTTLAPAGGQRGESSLSGQRQPDGLELVPADGQWIVEEDHDSIAREVLKGALVRRHQLAQHAVVLAQHVEQLLWCCGLSERRKAAQVREERRDVRAVPR